MHKELIWCLGILFYIYYIIFSTKMPWIHITKSFWQYCLAVSLPFAFVLQKGYNFYLVSRHFYIYYIIFSMKMPWIHITKSFRQYFLAVSLPFAFVLQKGYNFYKKKWFSTLCTQRVNLMTICFYYFFVMLMHWTQNIESFGKFQQVVLFLFPYVFGKVYDLY